MDRSATNSPASARSRTLRPASTLRGVWGIQPEDLPQPGYTAEEIMEAIHRGEIKGLLSTCFNPLVSLPDANFTREALSKLEFFGVIDFFLSETAHHADVVLAGSLHEEEDGLGCSAEGRVIHWQKSIDPPARRGAIRTSSSTWLIGWDAVNTSRSRIPPIFLKNSG